VGLLGGSFNPAHTGHRDISLEALRRLKLDEIWWLVSPQNPLKPAAGMARMAQRLAGARALARHPRIRAAPLEAALGTVYTLDTLDLLTRRFPSRMGRMAGHFRVGSRCGFRPAHLFFKGAGRGGGAALCPPPPARGTGREPGGAEAARLGVHP
jgi:hypothetical protein